MINFPDSPTLNQVYTTIGLSWKWDGIKWRAATITGGGEGGSTNIGVADTPPSSPSVGDGWWDSVAGQLYIWYNDGTSSQWVAASSYIQSDSSNIAVSDTPPPFPSLGDGWWDGVSGQLFIWVNDGTSNQWVAASSKPGPTGPMGPPGAIGASGPSTLDVLIVTGTTLLPIGTKGLVLVNNSNATPVTITLPASPVMGNILTIKDGLGTSETYPITINGLIDSVTSMVLNYARSWLTIAYTGTQWVQI